jgi:hypothetical protein
MGAALRYTIVYGDSAGARGDEAERQSSAAMIAQHKQGIENQRECLDMWLS